MGRNKPKNHHYIPQFLLRHFVDTKGHLWLHKRGKDVYCTSPKQAFKQKNLNRMVDLDRTLDYRDPCYTFEAEEDLGRLDNHAASAIRELIAFVQNTRHKGQVLFQVPEVCKRIDTIKLFFHSMCRRSPDRMKAWGWPKEQYGDVLHTLTNKLNAEEGLPVFDRQEFTPEMIEILQHRGRVKFAAAATPWMQDDLEKFCHDTGLLVRVIHSSKKSFVIGDRGVIRLPNEKHREESWLPIACDVAIGITCNSEWLGVHPIDNNSHNWIKKFNRHVAQQSEFIASHSEDLVRSLMKYREH